MSKAKMNRRTFLSTVLKSSAALSLPMIIPGSALGKNGAQAPSNRIAIACIGMGNMGTSNLRSFLNEPHVQIVAVCDIDSERLAKAKHLVEEKTGNSNVLTFDDFREMLIRDDIDAISNATPDHWHAIPAIMAVRNGKDIYSEKPLSYTLSEGRAICDAVKQNGRVWQTGSWQRSQYKFRFACELVRNGCIGQVKKVEVGLPAGFNRKVSMRAHLNVQEPPKTLNYDFWLGPAPYTPYFPEKVHWNWRWNLDYAGGQLLDWIGHHVDIAHWGLDLDYAAPIEIEGVGEYPEDGPWTAASKYYLKSKYENGVEMVIAGGYPEIRRGTKWIGEDGWVHVNRKDGFSTSPENLMHKKFGANDVHLYKTVNHHRNFIECVKSRATTITPCEIAHRSQTPGHLGQIAMLLKRKIKFDPNTEEILGDPEASRMLSRPMRPEWSYLM